MQGCESHLATDKGEPSAKGCLLSLVGCGGSLHRDLGIGLPRQRSPSIPPLRAAVHTLPPPGGAASHGQGQGRAVTARLGSPAGVLAGQWASSTTQVEGEFVLRTLGKVPGMRQKARPGTETWGGHCSPGSKSPTCPPPPTL